MTETIKDAAGLGRGGLMSRQRKREAVLRPPRGEDLDTISRSLGVTAATLSARRAALALNGTARILAQGAKRSLTLFGLSTGGRSIQHSPVKLFGNYCTIILCNKGRIAQLRPKKPGRNVNAQRGQS
jgi:hypothetical protein